ncbi:trypsin-like serine peptidase [Roseovarius salinarum]|uniref:trypsin-like serine peptidase n=1 Tax=Roseovarius salinarum TaxID=1981892 RepID=UPI000C33D9B3|nr:trypsin-like peptidase domain-containing protein [Roseovarius salinarum]
MIRAVLLTAALIAGVGPATAGSELMRLTQRDDLFGWEAVGRLDIAGAGYCTGVLIAPDEVLTAAHCVHGDPSGPVEAGDVTFKAGLRDGESIARRGIARVAVHPAHDPSRPASLETIRHDVALLKLDNAIPAATAAPFALHDGATGAGRVSVVSYGRGRDAALSWQRDCGIVARGEGVIAFDCDVTFGSSGAPVFVRTRTRARILSLVSGGVDSEGRPLAYGMELPGAVAALRHALRTTPGPAAQSGGFRRERVGSGARASGAKFAKP